MRRPKSTVRLSTTARGGCDSLNMPTTPSDLWSQKRHDRTSLRVEHAAAPRQGEVGRGQHVENFLHCRLMLTLAEQSEMRWAVPINVYRVCYYKYREHAK
jgi:hypothetical protein